MDPLQPNQPVTTSPTDPAPSPAPAPAPEPAPAPISPIQASGSGSPDKNKRTILFIIAGIAAALLIAALAYFLLVIQPNNRIKGAANEFVKTSIAGDTDDATELTDSEDSEKQGVQGLIKSLDSQVGSDDYKIDKFSKDGETAKVTYVVDGNKEKTFTLGLTKKDGKWLINNIVLNIGASKAEDTEAETSPQTAATAPTQCLPYAAIEKFWRYKMGWQFYFEPDTNEVLYSGAALTSIDEMKVFSDNNKQYNYTFVLDVSLYQGTGSASDKQLAYDRANVTAYNMHLKGIPYENMRYGTVNYSGGSASNEKAGTVSRYVNVSINSECNAMSTPQNLEKR